MQKGPRLTRGPQNLWLTLSYDSGMAVEERMPPGISGAIGAHCCCCTMLHLPFRFTKIAVAIPPYGRSTPFLSVARAFTGT